MKVRELKPDPKNANRGSSRGSRATTTSLKKYGAARSIVVDKDNRIIAGNHVAAHAPEAGIHDAIVVESDGSKLVVVRRTDLSLDDPKARELAIADNRTAELGLEWNPQILGELSGNLDLKAFFTGDELTKLIAPALEDPDDYVDTEVNPDDWELECKCPRCGFQFDPKKHDAAK